MALPPRRVGVLAEEGAAVGLFSTNPGDLDYLSGVTAPQLRWWPLGKARPVVLNPRRLLGAPATARAAVPTSALYAAHLSRETSEDIAAWYQAPVDEVHAAIEFERARAA